MKQKKLETLLYSAIGIAAMAIILITVNYLAATFRSRVDLTADKLYTLSDGTKKIVGKLDTKVKIRLYYSQRDNAMPVFLKTYAQRVEDLLVELKQQSKFIEIEKLDPQPDSDAEDSANLDGVEGQPTQTGEKIYLGVSINCLDQKVALPFLSPEREKLLEYDLARAIARVANPTKPVIGVLSALPVFGTPMNPMMMRMGQAGGQQPAWYLISELKNDFDVKQLEMNVTEIPADVKVLLVIHPRDITDAAQFAIDQFVLRGGKLIAFLDPVSYVDQQRQGGNPMMGGGPPTSSSLDKLLAAWGVGFDKTKCVADMKYVTRMGRGQRVEQQPAVLSLSADAIDRNDIATSQVDSLMIGFGGAFTGSPVEGLKQVGIDAATVKDVIISHMHYDHSGNHGLFPNAQFHLQDREMQFVSGRYMTHAAMRLPFDVEDVVAMIRRLYGGRVTFHNGDDQIAPGVSVHLVGGHSLGLQMVRVWTRRGWVVLASDAAHYYANLTRRMPFPVVVDVAGMLEGHKRLVKAASSPDHFIPGHDPLVLKRYPVVENVPVPIARLHCEPAPADGTA